MRRRKKTNEKEKKRPMSMHSSMTSRVPKEERKWLRPTIWLLFIGIFEILTHCGRGKWNTAPRILIRTLETSRRTHWKTLQADTISNYLYIQILCKNIRGHLFMYPSSLLNVGKGKLFVHSNDLQNVQKEMHTRTHTRTHTNTGLRILIMGNSEIYKPKKLVKISVRRVQLSCMYI